MNDKESLNALKDFAKGNLYVLNDWASSTEYTEWLTIVNWMHGMIKNSRRNTLND